MSWKFRRSHAIASLRSHKAGYSLGVEPMWRQSTYPLDINQSLITFLTLCPCCRPVPAVVQTEHAPEPRMHLDLKRLEWHSFAIN